MKKHLMWFLFVMGLYLVAFAAIDLDAGNLGLGLTESALAGVSLRFAFDYLRNDT